MATQQTFDFLDTHSETGATGLLQKGTLPAIETVRSSPVSSVPPSPSSPATPSPADRTAVSTDRKSVLHELRSKVGCINTAPDNDHVATLSTGSDAIDHLLPRGGLRLDGVTEWVAEADGCGAAALSMVAASAHLKSSRGDGPLVVVCGSGQFYPPAAVAMGIPVERIILVRPTRHADVVWAIDQALRCESAAAVWAQVGSKLDDRDARRFQLAAEVGRTPGLFVRPVATRGRPSFADVRLHVDNLPTNDLSTNDLHSDYRRTASNHRAASGTLGRVVRVTVDRCRGGTVGRHVWVQIDDQVRVHQVTSQQLGICDETATVHLASELAHPKTPNRKASRRRA